MRSLFFLGLVQIVVGVSPVFAQLYVTNDWTMQTNKQIAVASKAEYRDFWFKIDENQFVSLGNEIHGPQTRSSGASGYGKVTDNNAISEMVGVPPAWLLLLPGGRDRIP